MPSPVKCPPHAMQPLHIPDAITSTLMSGLLGLGIFENPSPTVPQVWKHSTHKNLLQWFGAIYSLGFIFRSHQK